MRCVSSFWNRNKYETQASALLYCTKRWSKSGKVGIAFGESRLSGFFALSIRSERIYGFDAGYQP